MHRRLAGLTSLALAQLALGCSRPASPAGSDPAPSAAQSAPVEPPRAPSADEGRAAFLARFLPETSGGFSGATVQRGDVFARRRYERGEVHVEVTIGDAGSTPVAYAQWVKMSAGDPPIALDVPPGEAAGFYDCAQTPRGERCDGHIHMRAGYHIELMTNASATRADLDAVLSGIGLRALAASAPAPATPAAPAGRAPASAPRFRADVLPHLEKACAGATGCHGAEPTHSVALDLRAPVAYRQLVGHRAKTRPGAVLVVAGSPEKSFLIDKLTGALGPKEGKAMPLDEDTGAARELTDDDRAFVDDVLVPWVASGARDD